MKLIILDRDGVINNDLGTYVTRPNDFVFADGAIPAIARLKQAGYLVAIATNQAGIARGLYSHEDLAAIHAKMLSAIRSGGGDIDRIVYCPSYDDDNPWRKPNSGMVAAILSSYNIDASEAVFIGDSVRDMEAGATERCHLIMVENNRGRQDYDNLAIGIKSRARFAKNLLHATEQLIQHN